MYRLIKRLFDFLFGLTGMILLFPIFIFVTLVLIVSAENQVFYFQERVGYNNKPFMLWKFATMLKNSLNMGTGSITITNDFRVTKPGKYLRKSKLNELPQIINIILGDISIVGPRPLVKKIFDLYPNKIQSIIYSVKPGLTGIGSIVFRDEESLISQSSIDDPHLFYKNTIAPYKANLELWYQQNQSFLLDLQLIFLTFWVVIFPKSRIYEKCFKDLPKRDF